MHGGDIYNNKIKYDFSVNLNPFGPYSEVVNAVRDAVDNISAYPEYGAKSFKADLSEMFSESVNVVITNGASEGIMSLVRALDTDNALVEIPSFYGYEYAINAEKRINANYILRDELLCENCDLNSGDIVIIANPTNPAGEFLDISKLDELYSRIKAADSYLIIDESFISISDFYMHSFINKVKEKPDYYSRVFIIRSFTKSFSIPGVRLGYVVSSNADIMDRLNNMIPEWNVSVLAIAAGKECLRHIDRLYLDIRNVKKERDYLTWELRKLDLKVLESCTPYVLFTGKTGLYDELLRRGILIRNCDDYRGIDIYKRRINPQIDSEVEYDEVGIYRIAVKTHKENHILIKEMRDILNGQ